MIGDKRIEEPKTMREAIKINESFGFKDYENFPKLYTAERLVKLNNEVYEALQKKALQKKDKQIEFLLKRVNELEDEKDRMKDSLEYYKDRALQKY